MRSTSSPQIRSGSPAAGHRPADRALGRVFDGNHRVLPRALTRLRGRHRRSRLAAAGGPHDRSAWSPPIPKRLPNGRKAMGFLQRHGRPTAISRKKSDVFARQRAGLAPAGGAKPALSRQGGGCPPAVRGPCRATFSAPGAFAEKAQQFAVDAVVSARTPGQLLLQFVTIGIYPLRLAKSSRTVASRLAATRHCRSSAHAADRTGPS